MFDRFRQSERTMTRTYNGLGLGLTIAKAIVDLHGGLIEASSPGVGKGSLLRIRLPLSAVAALSTVKTRTQDVAPVESLEGLRILLVDDDPGTREVLSQFLSSEGALVTVATSGAEAFDTALAEPMDVMVSDIGMPGMSGLELIERLRANPKTNRIQALALSAYQDKYVVRLCQEAGFDNFATKPIGRSELLFKITQLKRPV
jgi:CheY-like chemotaxis protein